MEINPHIASISLARQPGIPLQTELYRAIVRLVLAGRLEAGARLPSTRALGAQLGISRNTVLGAYDQLAAEGYVTARQGAGTRIADFSANHVRASKPPDRPRPKLRLSNRGERLSAIVRASLSIDLKQARTPFCPGVPDLKLFPHEVWARLLGRHARRPAADLLGYGDPAGYMPLRDALAQYLSSSRGVVCEAEQVVILSGAQAGLDLAARLLLDPGDPVWLEEPGYLGARAALTGAGARLTPVPVDGSGIDVDAGWQQQDSPKLIYVTPSHQYPMGATLSFERRLSLVDKAAQAGAWILEDDYDSEFRFKGRPIASLQGLDGGQRVIYLGTLAKIMLPALRLGYLVVPRAMVGPVRIALKNTGQMAPAVLQAALASFIEEGFFLSHIRRMRQIYSERRNALQEALAEKLAHLLSPVSGGGGLQLAALLPAGIDDRAAEKLALRHGIEAPALSRNAIGRLKQGGLFLGYGNVDIEQIKPAVSRLARALSKL